MLSPIFPQFIDGFRSLWMHSANILMMQCLICGVKSAYSSRENASDLMSKYPLIDGHNDLALQLRIHHDNRLSQIDLRNIRKVATDINRLKAGHVGAQVFAAYVLCGAQEKDAVRLTLEQIDVIRRMCTEHEDFELVTSAQGTASIPWLATGVDTQSHLWSSVFLD